MQAKASADQTMDAAAPAIRMRLPASTRRMPKVE
jgi:hypothetical protein